MTLRLAGHTVNAGLRRTTVELPVVAGLEVSASVGNVVAWGGTDWLYRLVLARGLAAAPDADRDLLLALGSVAGWRSGVLDLREDALGRLPSTRPDAAAAVLGLPAGEVTRFADEQARSALAWPLLDPRAPVARVGGFVGLGGPWIAPPRRVVRTGPGTLGVQCADGSGWAVRVDVFGARCLRSTDPVPDASPAPGATLDDASYLVTVTGEAG